MIKAKSHLWFFSCEHASNTIPIEFEHLFTDHKALLNSHRGYDLGSACLTEYLARQFSAPSLLSPVSRLVVDVNRSLYRRTLFSEITKKLPTMEKQRILRIFYYPHQERAKKIVSRLSEKDKTIFHLALHSFTPIFAGAERQVDLGILYNPGRKTERELALRWRRILTELEPKLRIRLNQPYRGKPDGLCARFRKTISDTKYAGFELEVNQKFYSDKDEAGRINKIIYLSLNSLFQ